MSISEHRDGADNPQHKRRHSKSVISHETWSPITSQSLATGTIMQKAEIHVKNNVSKESGQHDKISALSK